MFDCNKCVEKQYKKCGACAGYTYLAPLSGSVYMFVSNNNGKDAIRLYADLKVIFCGYYIEGEMMWEPGTEIADVTMYEEKGVVHTLVVKNAYGFENILNFPYGCPGFLVDAFTDATFRPSLEYVWGP